MNWLTQTTRFLQLDTPLGPNALAPLHFSGEEALSTPFEFVLQMVSDNPQIEPSHLLGRAITVTLNTGNGRPRYFNGYVHHFQAGHITQGTRYYDATLKPWLSFLNYTSDCRVFQQSTVIEIAAALFEEFGFTHYSTTGISGKHPSRDYCVQYRETALHFISRLFQEEGIYYYFQQEKGKHTLMLADSPQAIKPAPEALATFTAGSHKNQCITRFVRNYNFYTGKVTHIDYNHKSPDTPLQAQQQSSAKLRAAQKYEHFDYPGIYQDHNTGQNLAQQRFQAHEVQYDTLQGESNYSSFSSGSKFTINDAPAQTDNGDFTIVSIMHDAHDTSYLHDNNGNQSYHNLFSCIPASTPYRSTHPIAKPVVHGAQSALVVGTQGQELETSKYGQIKVQFHWDRKGKKNEYSSCWLRVAQLWAGKNWGAVFMPRMGQEVIVHFLEGDPDRPLIMGTVYNGDNMPPYSMPGEQTKSGIRTASTKGAGADEYNELYFEDNKGSEEIYIQAQKDFNKLVKNNMGVTVQNDHTHTTQHDSKVTVGNDYTHATASNSLVTVGNNYTHATTANATQTVGSDYTHTTANNSTVSVGNDYTQSTANNANLSVGNNFSHMISNSAEMNVGNTAIISAMQSIILQVGATTLTLSPSGIIIKAASIKADK